jgi:hypothetical protein
MNEREREREMFAFPSESFLSLCCKCVRNSITLSDDVTAEEKRRGKRD